jgi:hypothetical protein
MNKNIVVKPERDINESVVLLWSSGYFTKTLLYETEDIFNVAKTYSNSYHE